MRTLGACAIVALSLSACKHETPSGTTVVDWTYTPTTPSDSVPAPLSPPRTVQADAEWPSERGPVQLHFETEIGEQLVAGMRWHSPRHVRVTLAQPTTAKMPDVDCMPAPPGNKVEGGKLVPPVGQDASTPLGRVSCFFKTTDGSVFSIDGDGKVTRSVTNQPRG